MSTTTMGAMLTLVLNGYGQDAMKLARSIYEAEINALWLKKHPKQAKDFLQYNIIQRKEIFDLMGKDQQQAMPVEMRESLEAEYTEALLRFGIGKDKGRARKEWCATPFADRARAAEEYWREQMKAEGTEIQPLSLHRAFYRPASSIHHADIGGLTMYLDSEGNFEFPPSWNSIEQALVNGMGSFIRLLHEFDAIAQLGLAERIQHGPISDYTRAVKSL